MFIYAHIYNQICCITFTHALYCDVIVYSYVYVQDRHEFKKFQVNLSDADWVPVSHGII